MSDNLPAALSSFVGREEELAGLLKLLAEFRLVTIAGPPGVGKTRLAVEVAAEVAPNYADGVYLVNLSPVRDRAGIVHALAAAMSVPSCLDPSISKDLLEHLSTRRTLLLMDNCEHVASTAAELFNDILRACRGVSVLVTSQEPLAIVGEVVWRLSGLAVPDPAQYRPEALADYGAIRLFLDRAGTFQPQFALTAEGAPIIAQICRRLDGVPLAIELAAARIGMLDLAEILRRLDDRFLVLTGGSCAVVPRHRTLRAAFDWSYDLLSDREKLLLQDLSIFAGGFSIEAVEEVCAHGGEEGENDDVFNVLLQLVVKSLVMVDTESSEARYRMPESLLAYARDRLVESGRLPEVRARHGRWCLDLSVQAEAGLITPHRNYWLNQLDTEHDNIRVALDWAISNDHPEAALRLGGAMVLFWQMRGHFSEGRQWLEAAMSTASRRPVGLFAKALWGSGFLATMMGDYDTAIPALEGCLSRFRQLGDKVGCARSLAILGRARQGRNDDPNGVDLFQESAALAEEAGDQWCLANALAFWGLYHVSRNELETGQSLLEQCLAVAREAQEERGVELGLLGLGSIQLARGDYRAARPFFEEARRIASDGPPAGKATSVQHLGAVSMAGGQYGEARLLLEEALALAREAGLSLAIPECLMLLGRVAREEDDAVAAGRLFHEALAAAQSAGATSSASVHAVGELAEASGDYCAARRSFDEALALARSAEDSAGVARGLYGLGRLARYQRQYDQAALLYNDALMLQAQIGNIAEVVTSLEAVAGLAAETGRCHRSARLFGAADAIRQSICYAMPPSQRLRHEADLTHVGQMLSSEEFQEAWTAGASSSIDEAISFATRGRGPRGGRPLTGWESLSPTESAVAALVVEGLTNPQIAQRLFMSLGTVKAHLSHIFAKLGIQKRRELARVAWQRGFRPS
ncbi:MAG TPA: tetratricopeptide repeat protein [Chloroflexota bacterium]|nr:tetratricopeptide repeat protein [Chloroflexota bacterium]